MATFSFQLTMKKVLILLVLFGFSASAQPGKPYALSKDGVTVYTYDFAQLEQLLNKQTDSIYVVNFWATWCAPCIKELPHFEAIGAKYKNQKVKILLVSLDRAIARAHLNEVQSLILRERLEEFGDLLDLLIRIERLKVYFHLVRFDLSEIKDSIDSSE